MVSYSGMPKICHYFTYDPFRMACLNDVECIDPSIVACYMSMSESIRTAGFLGIGFFQGATLSDQGGCLGYNIMPL